MAGPPGISTFLSLNAFEPGISSLGGWRLLRGEVSYPTWPRAQNHLVWREGDGLCMFRFSVEAVLHLCLDRHRQHLLELEIARFQ